MPECNGESSLCDVPVNLAMFAGSHNAMSSPLYPGWLFAEQTSTLTGQLDAHLLIDTLLGIRRRLRLEYHRDHRPAEDAGASASATVERAAIAERAGSQHYLASCGARRRSPSPGGAVDDPELDEVVMMSSRTAGPAAEGLVDDRACPGFQRSSSAGDDVSGDAADPRATVASPVEGADRATAVAADFGRSNPLDPAVFDLGDVSDQVASDSGYACLVVG